MGPASSRLLWTLSLTAWTAALASACAPSPGSLVLDTNTAVSVGVHALQPRSTVTFTGDALNLAVVMVTDHPNACAEMRSVDVCQPEYDLAHQRVIDSPRAVATALVLSLDAATAGTYSIGAACFVSSSSAHLAFVVRDPDGRVVFRDEAVEGGVVLDELEPGAKAEGSYDVVLGSGAALRGRFSSTFCAGASALGTVNRECQRGTSFGVVESCSCRGQQVQSTCTQASLFQPWNCQCTDSQGLASSCTVPSTTPVPTCLAELFTCCPMRF